MSLKMETDLKGSVSLFAPHHPSGQIKMVVQSSRVSLIDLIIIYLLMFLLSEKYFEKIIPPICLLSMYANILKSFYFIFLPINALLTH